MRKPRVFVDPDPTGSMPVRPDPADDALGEAIRETAKAVRTLIACAAGYLPDPCVECGELIRATAAAPGHESFHRGCLDRAASASWDPDRDAGWRDK